MFILLQNYAAREFGSSFNDFAKENKIKNQWETRDGLNGCVPPREN